MQRFFHRLIKGLIILVGLGILLYPSISVYLSEKNATEAVEAYEDAISKTKDDKIKKALAAATAYNHMLVTGKSIAGKSIDGKSIDSQSIDETVKDGAGHPVTLESYADLLNLTGNGVMGYIYIPKLNIKINIHHGTENAVMQIGIGHLQGSSLPVGGKSTHAVLTGHRGLPSVSLFTDLDQLKKGDRFYLRILNKTLCYRVDQIVTVLPNNLEQLAIKDGKDYVTLVTCTPYGVNSHRLLVRGRRTAYKAAAGGKLPKMKTNSLRAFWHRLPAQYRHLIMGLTLIILIIMLRRILTIVCNILTI